jgi:hypothetical protein
VLWLAVLALGLAASCGDEGPSSPSGPSAVTPPLPVIVASVAGAPLTAVATAGTTGHSLQTLAAEVSLRESAGLPGRIVLLTASVLDDTGPLAPSAHYTLSLDVAAGGTVRHEFRHGFELHRFVEQGRLRLAYQGQSVSGTAFDLTPVEVPVRFSTLPPAPAPSVTFVGAGDIGQCGSAGPELTARLLDGIPGVVFTLGDNAYPDARPENFQNCYHPSWGRHRSRTRPIPGNHDWYNNTWFGYFDYFGPVAGTPGLGYYSFDLGAWHVLALNSNLHGNLGSPQYEFARADLASTRASCILAYWHHPLYSSGPSGGDRTMRDIWRLLQEHGAEFVMGGHDHIYERFAPQDSDGRIDLARGLRSFVVGTGGYELYALGPTARNSEVRDNQTWGVLRLTLHPTGYDWEFVPVAGRSFRDSGSATCSP